MLDLKLKDYEEAQWLFLTSANYQRNKKINRLRGLYALAFESLDFFSHTWLL